MPGAVRTCFLCGRSERGAQSMYMTIDCFEQERRIRDAYFKRHKIQITGSLIDKEVHRQCYRSILQRQPLATVQSRSHPRKYSARVQQNRSRSKSSTTVMIDPGVPNVNTDDLINNILSDSSITVNNDKENHLGGIEENDDESVVEDKSCTDLSNSQRSKACDNLTNVDLRPKGVIGDTNQSSSNICIDVYDTYPRAASEEPLISPNINNSPENIVTELDLVMIDFDRGDTSEIDTGIRQQTMTMASYHEIQSSTELISSNSNRNNDSWIDFDTDDDLFSSNDVQTQSNDSIFPLTSTEKIVRATPFGLTNQHIMNRINLSNSHIEHEGPTGSDPIDSNEPISRNERNSPNVETLSGNNQRKKRCLECSGLPDRSFNQLKRSCRSRSSAIDISAFSFSECDAGSRLFANGFDELCEWLFNLLEGGLLVPMTEVAVEYERILNRRNETCTESMLRTSSIRHRFEVKYGEMLHFDKLNNYEGTFVALSDVSTYVRMAMSTSNVWTPPQQDDAGSQQKTCENMINVIEQLRQSIRSHAFLFRKFMFDRLSIVEFDEALFWSCVPLLLKNFMGLLTLSEDQYQKIKTNHEFYDLTVKDLFIQSPKSLKIASISYDIIHVQNEKAITPKHLLLGNEIFHHTRSANLLQMTNRLGHTAGYDTIFRLHQEAAEKSRESFNPVADNFDYNPDGIHGTVHNIHILNQILVSTTENDETSAIVQQLICDIVNDVIKSVKDCSINSISDSTNSSSLSMTTAVNVSYPLFTHESFKDILFGYGLAKLSANIFGDRPLPLLSGFFATYLPSKQRPLHTVSFLTPINDDPSSESAAKACLSSTKEMLLDSNYQCEAILVVDEKIYRSCVKIKRRPANLFDKVFIYAGDFHLMKNTMVVIWGVLKGSGIEEILGLIYHGASLRALLDVNHFNKSLRCCKLIYTSLLLLLLESFVAAHTGQFDSIESILKELPNEFSKQDIKQEWFSMLIEKIQEIDFYNQFHRWCIESAEKNVVFRLWSFITFSLFEPLIELYISIRTCNFDARNAALSRLAPLFFSTNHRNYARLSAQHLIDLKMSSPYLLDRLARAFAVNRSNRPFSYIALDQTIECTINKYGKSHGGIDGRFTDQTIDQWIHSFSFRALASNVMHNICQIETAGNSIDSHAECAPKRQDLDHQDLTIIMNNLRSEDLFTMKNSQCRKLRSGLLFHKDIIENICTLHERGCEALIKYVNERLIGNGNKVDVDTPLKAMPRLKFIHAASYVPGNPNSKKKNQATVMEKIIKEADDEIRRIIIIAQQRQLSLTNLLAHEFGPASLALCHPRNPDLIYQRSKSDAISFLRKLYPSAFHSSYPQSMTNSAIVIDGGSLLETKPLPTSRTIRDYAEQLLKCIIGSLFKEHKRIDIVFDTSDSKVVKMFTERHEHDVNKCSYQLKGSDKLQSPFNTFVHSNRAALASCVRKCWCEPGLINIIPPGCLFVVGGPEESAVKLEYGLPPLCEDLLESNHVEADTRMMLHMNVVKIDNEQNTVVIQSSDTDVVLLTIAFGSSVGMDHVFIKSFNTRTKKNTIVDVKAIARDMIRRLKVDPIILLILHALSGCDTTSFVRGVTKKKFLSTFFNDPHRYSELISFTSTPPPKEAISAAEQLLINCYPSRFVANSLDELRANMASHYSKERGRQNIIKKLPPSSSAFYHHCLRASRQVVIWLSSFEQHMKPPAMELSGYHHTEMSNQLKIKWTSLPTFPDDAGLATCGECSTGCTRCKCGTNKLPCTIFCRCKPDACMNQSGVHLNRHLPNSHTHASLNGNKGSNVVMQLPVSIEDDDEDESDSSHAGTSDNDSSDSAAEDDGDEMDSFMHSNTCSTSIGFQSTTTANNSPISHIDLDHDYCTLYNDNEQITRQKRERRDVCQSASVTNPPSKIYKSPQIIVSKDSEPTLPITPQSSVLRSSRPKARFLKHFRPRCSSSSTT